MHRSLKLRLSTSLFLALDRIGIHVLPKHFYTPVSDYAWLRKNKDSWLAPSEMCGIDWKLDDQLEWLSGVCERYRSEVAGLQLFQRLQTQEIGYGYGPIESQVLHCFIRTYAPRHIVEVGSGVSTACMLEAVRRNVEEGRQRSSLTCIEPFPKKQFESLANVRHIRSSVQGVDRAVFEELEDGDFLFIDCSHAVKTGSDVVMLYLEVLPKLRPGVRIHIHDINLPYLYFRETLSTYFEWQETALLAALLVNNSKLSISASLSGLHYERQQGLAEVLPDYRPAKSELGLSVQPDDPSLHFPSAIYLETR